MAAPIWGIKTTTSSTAAQARIILAALVTPAEVQENQPALDLLWRTRFRWKLRPRQVTGDTKYGTVENIVAIEDERIRAYVPLPDVGPASRHVRRAGLHLRRRKQDVYRCPGGADAALPLALRDHAATRIYASTGGGVPRLPAQSAMHTSQRGRRVGAAASTRHIWTRVRGYHATEPYAEGHAQTAGLGGTARSPRPKTGTGCGASGLRGLEQVNGEALLIAAGQNLKRLLSRWGWGRRPFPNGVGRGRASGVLAPASPDAMTASLLSAPFGDSM